MDLVDLIVTPFYILVILLIAYGYQINNKKNFLVANYFLGSYFLRILGGMAFACVYAFYYGGGDTLNYHHDSTIISGALRNSPLQGIELLFTSPNLKNTNTYEYVIRMVFKSDPAAHFISALAAVFNLITFDSFLATTICFSLLGFWGNWQLFKTLCKLYPSLHRQIAIGCLYLPSILFWTSGLMKDTLCTVALCFLFSAIVQIYALKNSTLRNYLIAIISIWVLYTLKIYILICFIPTISIYIFSFYTEKIKSKLLRNTAKPFFYLLAISLSYLAFDFISQNDSKYSLEELESTAKVTASYIGRISIQSGGSFYTLGELDFSLSNIPSLAFRAFVVTFYRPFFWEISSPLMLFSVLESIYFMYLSFLLIRYIFRHALTKEKIFTPFTTFCFLFAITFSFVVGVTSNNFGTLARYKSLMLPFFVCGVYATVHQKRINNIVFNESLKTKTDLINSQT